MPGADWARALAQSRYPELFDSPFAGTAVVAAVFDRDGTLKLASEHLFAPGMPPSDLDMASENLRGEVDPLDDILYSGGEYGSNTIAPWLQTKNPGRVLIVYEVLKWPHDPSRTPARVEAALKTYAPQLFQPTEPSAGGIHVTVFMNDDGTVNQLTTHTTSDDAVTRFAAMGIEKNRLGRRGFLVLEGSQASVDYAWPRRPDDAPDVADLNTAWRQIFVQYPSREDHGDDARLVQRYFPKVQAQGYRAVTEVVNGQRTFLIPWILFGRDGRVWDSGFWHTNSTRMTVYSSAFSDAIADRYPGTRVDLLSTLSSPGWYVGRVPIVPAWIAADSPIQRKSDVSLQSRKDVLVTGALFWKVKPLPNRPANSALLEAAPAGLVCAVDFGVPTGMGLSPGMHPLIEITVTPIDQQSVKVMVRAPGSGPRLGGSQQDPASWTQIVPLEIPYGQAATAILNDGTGNPEATTRLVLRAEKLRG